MPTSYSAEYSVSVEINVVTKLSQFCFVLSLPSIRKQVTINFLSVLSLSNVRSYIMYGLVVNGGILVHPKFPHCAQDRQVRNTYHITQQSAYGFSVTGVTCESSSIGGLLKDAVTAEWDTNITNCQRHNKEYVRSIRMDAVAHVFVDLGIRMEILAQPSNTSSHSNRYPCRDLSRFPPKYGFRSLLVLWPAAWKDFYFLAML
jgi:hypothetical protein